MARQITKTEMLALYEAGNTDHEVNTGNRLYAHSLEVDIETNPQGYEVVYCIL